jgi:dihydrofolate synthase / folylpolyglutamate synthase
VSSYRDTLGYLYSLEYRGIKFGLRNIRALVRDSGHPERAFPSIHVAGTNGKGSTSAFLASAFTEAGYRTGLYTSPHLVRFTERIRIDGEEIDGHRLVEYVRRLRPLIEKTRATFFEATTCVAFLYFADEKVGVAVIETGLGGRLDATNVLRPLVSVITNVSLEHTEMLGKTVRAIAREKGGIIKPSIPVVTGSTDPAVLAVLRKRAALCGVRLRESSKTVSIVRHAGGKRVTLASPRLAPGRLDPGLAGEHQIQNAALALLTLDTLLRTSAGRRLSGALRSSVIRRAFERVARNTGIRGRLESLRSRGRSMLLDVAHNPAGMVTLVRELQDKSEKSVVAVFGVMRDKDYSAMLAELATVADPVIAVAPDQKRALPAGELFRAGKDLGFRMVLGGNVASGIRKAIRSKRRGVILITGSHYVVGEALRALHSENT